MATPITDASAPQSGMADATASDCPSGLHRLMLIFGTLRAAFPLAIIPIRIPLPTTRTAAFEALHTVAK